MRSDRDPGRGIFSLEGRRAPGLYLVAWLLVVGGGALLFVATLTPSDAARVVLVVISTMALSVGFAAGAGSQIVDRRDRPPDRYRGPSPALVFLAVLATAFLFSGVFVGTGILDPLSPPGFLTSLVAVAA